jgi:glycosyltransferase involved in cell wall biosynthesis
VFRLLGFQGVPNPSAVSESELTAWVDEGTIEYLGSTDDVRAHIAEAHCAVLPSYREGTPRSLLEAAAMARAVIATDVPGCREVVDDGVTGYLCAPRDAHSLAQKMLQFLELPHAAREGFGLAGRRKMEMQFSEELVTTAYSAAIRRALSSRNGGVRRS